MTLPDPTLGGILGPLPARDAAIVAAEAAGKVAALAGEPFSANPHSMAQGSPSRILAIAFRRGFRQGELEQADADGDLFRSKL